MSATPYVEWKILPLSFRMDPAFSEWNTKDIEARIESKRLREAADQLMKATVPLAVRALPPAPSKHVPDCRSSYLGKYLDGNLRIHVDLAVRVLRDYEFDSIAFRGMSGALLAPAIAIKMDKTLLMVRKPNDNSHARRSLPRLVEGDFGARSYVIVDDLIYSGTTVRAIRDAVRDFAPHAQYIGTLCVNSLERQFERYAVSSGIEKIRLHTAP